MEVLKVVSDRRANSIAKALDMEELVTGQGKNQETTLKRTRDTRWSSHYGTICSLILLFSAVMEVLKVVSDNTKLVEQSASAEILLDGMKQFDFVLYLNLMEAILGITDDLSQTLQRKDQDINNAMRLVSVSKQRLQNLRDNGWENLLSKICSLYVPKLLLHRLFPNARYSLWIDGKLELVRDPFQILERFLWRKNSTFAISRHYRRFDVFEEAEANKAAGKYDNASIDYQIEFYKKVGLTHYTETKLPITSDVPEGCVIIKEHIPITNIFTCLWFNDVDHFTSRDQISFSTIRDRIMSQVNWHPDMFWDCERRNFVVQTYHKDLLEYMRLSISPPPPPLALAPPPPSPRRKRSSSEIANIIVKKPPRRSKDRRSGLRRNHRSRYNNARDKNSL
ncbi:hypothetical protein ZOSMA_97G00060 [Zostera marina]|uniref:TOD1/MUCI70 glycosyltransferase-like domain-containing protein n=1 Tax=Zostera marina TaxID=29655 RepID=A0A0K9NHJ9_ZOSMR|nr:hypothetical protein ZOSMA_97G00060 [Zostera marina]